MNKGLKRSILVLGVFIGAILVFQNYCYADSQDGKSSFDVESIMTPFNEGTIEISNNVLSDSKLIKIYNNADRLIYETKDSQDERLEQLINKSDYLTEISNTIYYKLSR